MRLFLSGLILFCFVSCFSQRTTRARLRPKQEVAILSVPDTLWLDSAQVRFAGYEKTLRSSVESMFITNNSTSNLSSLTFTIEYFDMAGNPLHLRTESVEVDLPASHTRMVKFPSWDRQKVWYYHLSDPVRTRAQATPYRVKVHPLFGLIAP